jgi:hypothetical protein
MYDLRMDEAQTLRHQAKRARRLAGLIADRQASDALEAYAEKLLAQAEFLEENVTLARRQVASAEQPSAQQQQQIQPLQPASTAQQPSVQQQQQIQPPEEDEGLDRS